MVNAEKAQKKIIYIYMYYIYIYNYIYRYRYTYRHIMGIFNDLATYEQNLYLQKSESMIASLLFYFANYPIRNLYF